MPTRLLKRVLPFTQEKNMKNQAAKNALLFYGATDRYHVVFAPTFVSVCNLPKREFFFTVSRPLPGLEELSALLLG